MKIEQFDRTTCRTVQDRVDQALAAVAAEFGLSFKRGSGRFTASNFVIKSEFTIADGVSLKDANRAEDYEFFAKLNGIEHKLGDKVNLGDKKFIIKGWRSKAPKRPVVVTDVNDNRDYVISVLQLKMARAA